jgi:hypothetical protein
MLRTMFTALSASSNTLLAYGFRHVLAGYGQRQVFVERAAIYTPARPCG